MSLEFYETAAIVVRGKLKFDGRSRQALDQALGQFAEGAVTVRVERHHAKRTDAQNRFWHGVVIPLFAEHTGESFEEAKRTLALELIPEETRKLDGTIVTTAGHTSDLNVAQFNDLIKRAQELGARYDIYIPDPGEMAQTG